MSKQAVTWAMLAGETDTLTRTAPPSQETCTVRRVPRSERLYIPPPATVTMPRDLDAERLRDSVAALPAGLSMEFSLVMPSRVPAFYISKRSAGVVSHWATFALHIDPIYGEWQQRDLPRNARRWLGRTPWATALMIAHEVPAWCISTFPDPRRLPVDHLVSDISNHRVRTIDPILYGVMVAGAQWGFVPLASWRL